MVFVSISYCFGKYFAWIFWYNRNRLSLICMYFDLVFNIRLVFIWIIFCYKKLQRWIILLVVQIIDLFVMWRIFSCSRVSVLVQSWIFVDEASTKFLEVGQIIPGWKSSKQWKKFVISAIKMNIIYKVTVAAIEEVRLKFFV